MTGEDDTKTGVPLIWLIGGLIVALATMGVVFWFGARSIVDKTGDLVLRADPRNAAQVALGAEIYRDHCASCHGADLEGEPGWERPTAVGPPPAPPHTENGHSWHHGDQALFTVTKFGPGKAAGPENVDPDIDTHAFEGDLGDGEIWAALAFIKSGWPESIRARQFAATLGEGAHDDEETSDAMAIDDAMDTQTEAHEPGHDDRPHAH